MGIKVSKPNAKRPKVQCNLRGSGITTAYRAGAGLVFQASEGILAQKVLILALTILLLQQMKILPCQVMCERCNVVITDNYKSKIIELHLLCSVLAVKEPLSRRHP